MSYSFSDEEEASCISHTMMVPFVDILNHHSTHNVELTFHSKYLRLVAVKNIHKVDRERERERERELKY